MAAPLPDLPMLEHQNLVGVEDRAQAVSDHQAGPSAHQLGDRPLDLAFGLGIHRAGGLIEHQDRRIERERPGKAQQLSLPYAQTPASLPQSVVVPGRKAFDEPVGPDFRAAGAASGRSGHRESDCEECPPRTGGPDVRSNQRPEVDVESCLMSTIDQIRPRSGREAQQQLTMVVLPAQC